MRKIFTMIALSATVAAQAQVLYVNNTNDTYQAIDTKETKEVTFDETRRIITFEMLDGVKYMFNTGKIEEVSLKGNKSEELIYSTLPAISFDENDKNSYNEIIETITNVETADNDYGDFVEHYSPSRRVTVEYTSDGPKVTTVSGVTYKVEGNDVTITSTKKKVVYTVQGKCDDGSLKIYSDNKFQIILNGVELTNTDGPAINIQTGKTVYFTIYDGTTNTLHDGATYSAPAVTDGEEEDQKGTLFSEGQLIFNGNGTLNVTSLGGHGISSDDYIRIRSGNINILQAAKDGFHTNDKFLVSRTKDAAPSITVNSAADGIDCGKGEVVIEAGKLDITSGGEAIKVEYEEENPDPLVTPNATIRGGYIKFTTTGEKSSGIKTTGNFVQTGGVIEGVVNGNGSKIINCDGNVSFEGGKITGFSTGATSADQTVAGGIKCENEINITAGNIAMECSGAEAKGVNCGGDITVGGGEITIVTVGEESSITIESIGITINGGKVAIAANDVAVSAAESVINDGILNIYYKEGTTFMTDFMLNGGWVTTEEK